MRGRSPNSRVAGAPGGMVGASRSAAGFAPGGDGWRDVSGSRSPRSTGIANVAVPVGAGEGSARDGDVAFSNPASGVKTFWHPVHWTLVSGGIGLLVVPTRP